MTASFRSRLVGGVGRYRFIVAIGALAAVAPISRAKLIDVQWNPSTTANIMTGNAATGSTNTGSGSTGATADVWNQINGSTSSNQALQDVTGASSGVTLTVSGTSGIGAYGGTVTAPSNSSSAPFYASVAPLYSNIIYSTSTTGTIVITFNGLSAGNYNLFLYSSGDTNSYGREIAATANGGGASVGPTDVGPGGGATSMTAGLNYAELPTVAVTAAGALTVDVNSPNASEIDIDGLQLQPAPEPASLALLGLGSLGLLVGAAQLDEPSPAH